MSITWNTGACLDAEGGEKNIYYTQLSTITSQRNLTAYHSTALGGGLEGIWVGLKLEARFRLAGCCWNGIYVSVRWCCERIKKTVQSEVCNDK